MIGKTLAVNGEEIINAMIGNAVFLTQIISCQQKKCWCKSCAMDFTSAKMEFALAIFQLKKGVVKRLPPF